MNVYNEKDEFGNRMKAYEASDERYLDLEQPIIVRVDGKRFSKFTSKLQKPFTDDLSNILEKTVEQVSKNLHCDLAYHQSDEITFVFIPKPETGVVSMIFNGRVQKVCSVIASMFTSIFIKYLNERQSQPNPLPVGDTPYFDCRVFNVPDVGEAANAILWRIQDCRKNFISCVYRYRVGHKQMQGLSGKQMLEDMKDRGIDIEDYPLYYHSGNIFYKSYYIMETGDEDENGVSITTIRGTYCKMYGSEFSDMSFDEKLKFLTGLKKDA